MKKITVGINGFGRIGRVVSRIILNRPNLQLAAINSRSDINSHAYLLKYDSTYGIFPKNISVDKDCLSVDGHPIYVFNSQEPPAIPWDKAGIDIVIDATGKFRSADLAAGHLLHDVKHVVISAPAKDDTKTIVFGVNENEFDDKSDKVVSNSSCTTNCLATTLSVIYKNFGVKRAFMTTVHAVTDSQNLLDNSHKKEVRLTRASFASMIPSSTGSAKDIGKLFKDLSGKIICQAIRIPLLTVSLINLTVETDKKVTKEEINNAYVGSSKNSLKGILDVACDQLVSKDFTGNPHSAIVDPYMTNVNQGNLVNIFAWYDNEWGYASRLADLVEYIGKKSI